MKTALITGSAKRVGREIALSMAKNGWDIVIHYNTSEKQALATVDDVKSLGRKSMAIQGDLSDLQSPAKIMSEVNDKIGKISCLINNAAIFEKDNILNMTVDSWNLHHNINYTAPILLAHEFFKQLGADSEGQIICLLDGMKGWSISPEFFSYSSSKIALASAIPMLADSMKPRVRVNAIALGATIEGNNDNEKTFAKIRRLTPLGSNSDIQSVCDAVLYLLSANNVTGQAISLSSGLDSI